MITLDLGAGNGPATSDFSYNVKNYGAKGDGSTNDTAAIQAAHDAAFAAGSKAVFFPAGNYSIDTLNWKPSVALLGESYNASAITARTAGIPLIQHNDDGFHNVPVVRDLYLNGNNLATIGLDLRVIIFFSFTRLYIGSFTEACVHTEGGLMGKWQSCKFMDTPTGYRARMATSNSAGAIQTNLVTFDDCFFQRNNTLGVDYAGGSGVHFLACNWENSGANGNPVSGALRYVSNGTDGNGVTLRNCWFEVNQGGFCVDIGGSVSKQVYHSIQDTLFHRYASGAECAVHLSGTNTLLDQNNVFAAHNGDAYNPAIIVDGSAARVVRLLGSERTVTLLNGGIFETYNALAV